MKISKIKKKLNKLFGREPEDNIDQHIDDMRTMIELLKQKEIKLIDKLVLTEDEEEAQAIKQKMSLIKKQLKKANKHIAELTQEN